MRGAPPSWWDHRCYIEALEAVRTTLIEGRKAGAFAFFIGGDIKIGLRFGNAGEDHHLREEHDFYKMLKEFNCTVTSIWTDDDDNREYYTLRDWGSQVMTFWGHAIYALQRAT